MAPVLSNLAQYVLCEIVACRSFLYKNLYIYVYVYIHINNDRKSIIVAKDCNQQIDYVYYYFSRLFRQVFFHTITFSKLKLIFNLQVYLSFLHLFLPITYLYLVVLIPLML